MLHAQCAHACSEFRVHVVDMQHVFNMQHVVDSMHSTARTSKLVACSPRLSIDGEDVCEDEPAEDDPFSKPLRDHVQNDVNIIYLKSAILWTLSCKAKDSGG